MAGTAAGDVFVGLVLRLCMGREVVRKTTQQKPSNATHWSTRTMAAASGPSEKSVRRIWHAHGLKPHLARTFKLSNDPEFARKLEAIVGLLAARASCPTPTARPRQPKRPFPVTALAVRQQGLRRGATIGTFPWVNG